MQALFFADERGAMMSKYDEFDLDIRKNADTVNDAGDALSLIHIFRIDICVSFDPTPARSTCQGLIRRDPFSYIYGLLHTFRDGKIFLSEIIL